MILKKGGEAIRQVAVSDFETRPNYLFFWGGSLLISISDRKQVPALGDGYSLRM